MKRYIAIFLIFNMVLLLCACSPKESGTSTNTPAPSSTAAKESDSQTDTAPAINENEEEKEIIIDITPPEGWEPVEGSVLQVQYMKNTASFMMKDEPFSSDTLDKVVDEAIGIYENAFDNLTTQGDVENITVDGKEARKLTFTCTISKMNMKYQYVYLFVEGKTYVITFGDLADNFDSLLADYEIILDNIHFNVK
jgi:hypothetical protein